MRLLRMAVLLVVCCGAAVAARRASESQAALRDVRRPLCNAVIREMHIEIHKHTLRKNGEDDIYETVPAICLAILQNYTLSATKPPSPTYSLKKRAVRLDDEESPNPDDIMHMMTLKEVCQAFTDELQQELSEVMYRAVLVNDAETIVAEFCTDELLAPPKPSPKPRRTADGAKPAKRADKSGGKSGGSGKAGKGGKTGKSTKKESEPVEPDMSELLKKYDTDGSISNLIEMERENPEAMLEPDDLKEVQRGAEQIRCDVCRAAAKVAYNRASKRRLLRDEEQLTQLVHGEICFGTPLDRVEEEYPKYPGNPPLWGELYTLNRMADAGSAVGAGDGRWVLARLAKGATPEEKGGKEYTELVVKHAMISRACKQVVLQHDDYALSDDDDAADLAQTLFEYAARTPAASANAKGLAASYCKAFCGAHVDDSGDVKSQKEEL